MDPIIFSIGSFKLQYYGLMYILAFVTTYLLANYRTKHEPRFPFNSDFHKDIMTAAFIGVLAGGRLGYVLFYNFSYYLNHPLEIILPIDISTGQFTGISGMSYHGGLIGVMVAVGIFCRKRKISYWEMVDLYGPIIPLGYTFGRLGNFINGELYGRVTESSIGMYFPSAPTHELRHPSQLYEAFFEGIACFTLMWIFRKKIKTPGMMAPFYLISYGFVRFFIEYFRQPDSHLGFVFLKFSMGQMLCLGMMATGVGFAFFLKKKIARE